MSIQRRLADNIDTMWMKSNTNVVGVWKFNSENDRDSNLEKLCKSFAGLHSHFENNHIVFEKRDVPVFKVPDAIKNLDEIADYVDLHCTRPLTTALSSIAIAEDAIAIVGSHCVLDGGTLTYLNNLMVQNLPIPEIGINPSTYEPFIEKINSMNYYLPPIPCDEKAVRFSTKDPQRLATTPYIMSMREHLKINDFQVYSQKDKKLHGFTESMFSSMILSMSAFNGKFDKTGLWEVFGTRPHAEKGYKLTQGQYFSNFNVYAENVTENDNVQTLMSKLREHMNHQIKRGAPWASLRGYRDNHFDGKIQEGTFTVLSSIGEFKTGGPVKDFLLQTTGNGEYGPSLNILSYNVKKPNDNDFYFVHSHSPQYFSFRESKAWINSVKYAVSKINPQTKIGDAVAELTDFQKQIMKKYDTVAKIIKF